MSAVAEPAGSTEETPRPAEALASYVEAVRRRATPMGIAFGAVLMLALLLAAFWPPTYLSQGTILIEQQEIPQDYVRSAISSYADERVQVISQRVMTSANLLSIIDKFGLYADAKDTTTREALVEHMRQDIKLEMISADVVDPRQGRATKATIAFSVGYQAPSPQTAARVANDIVSLYLSENLESRRQQAESSAGFLASEAEKIRQRTVELEQRLADFKQRNYDRLPELTGLNLQSMTNDMAHMREVDTRIRSLEQQLQFLDAQLAQVHPNAMSVTDTGERLMSPRDQLKSAKMELAAARSRYTAEHPTVIALQHRVEELERIVASGEIDTPTSPDNPTYVQLAAQRNSVASERNELREQRAQLAANVARYQRIQAETPVVEKDYVALVREVEGEQAKYNELRQKQLTAQLAQNLETEQKGERFTLIEPPLAPQTPVSPNRKAILALGLLLALGAAVGVMALFEALDPRVRGRRELVALVGVPPLAIIPWVAPRLDEQAKRRRRLQFVAGMAGGAVAMVLAVHVLVKPLDVLWAVLLRRLGAG